MHLCLFIYFFFIYIYITHVYIISYKKHEDVYIDIWYILCVVVTRVKSHPKSFIHMFVRTCARACALHWNPPPLNLSISHSSFYYISSIPSFIAIFSQSSSNRSIVRSTPFTHYIPLSLSRVRPSGACVNVWLHVRASSFFDQRGDNYRFLRIFI